MPNYILAYHGGSRAENSEAAAGQRARFAAWLDELRDAVVNPGIPMGPSKIVRTDGISNNDGPIRLTGFSIVKAGSLDHAVEIAKRCPYLEIGVIEVAEALGC